ncbi:MAG: methyltransferase domain-containing protein [Planctomycetota bacterium]
MPNHAHDHLNPTTDGITPPDRVPRACPLCGANRHSPLLARHGWQLVRCLECDLAYLPEIPAAERVAADLEWDASFARVRRERWLRSPWMRAWTMVAGLLRPSREVRAIRWIRRHAPAGRLLDVGCGNGRLVATALRAGYDACGVDVSPPLIKKALRRVPPERLRCGRLENQGWPDASFDVVVTLSFLEHEPRPAELARHLLRLLRPGGLSFHKVPNYDSHLRRLLGPRWSGYRWPEHLQYFTPATLGRLLREAGFEIVAVRGMRLGDNFWIAARKPE